MISLGVIGSTVFFLPGILYFVLRMKETTPALQSREIDSSSSLAAIALIATVSLLSHLLSIGSLWAFGHICGAMGWPQVSWDFSVFDRKDQNETSFKQVIQLLSYSLYACVIAALVSNIDRRRKSKGVLGDLTLSTLCRAQSGNPDLLLVAYVYFKARRGSDNMPISGLVGGVSFLRLDAKMNLTSIVLIEPVPFVQYIQKDTLEADILEYGDERKYNRVSDIADAEFVRQTITEISGSEISHVVYALHDRNIILEDTAQS